jgi:hypothetical protein
MITHEEDCYFFDIVPALSRISPKGKCAEDEII